jgi:hypothetical protein
MVIASLAVESQQERFSAKGQLHTKSQSEKGLRAWGVALARSTYPINCKGQGNAFSLCDL